ncbi:MAG: menaquinone biosynthetic enzyme MqnA/MqnD family protein [Planctomycetota bacterium]|jgi:chorismate dehydratase
MSVSATRAATTTRRPARLGVVSFVNTLPLIDGLERLAEVELRHSVPSLLIDQLLADEVDLALCSSIDYQRSPEPLVIVPVGLLGCCGPTLTVRLYSTRPLTALRRIYCDTDSHTSVALMRILLREQHGLDPELIDYDAREHVAENRPLDWPDAMLLIGDKVVTDSPPAVRYPFQLDLGAAWFELTGRPFVFATWMARQAADPALVRLAAAVLDRQRRYNQPRVDHIIHHRARPRNWPGDLAASYLKDRLTFDVTAARLEAMELFFGKAYEHGLIGRVEPLRVFNGDGAW